MHRALGDAEAQERIRDENQDAHHCAFLRRDPLACNRCPANLNPYDDPKKAVVLRAAEEHAEAVEDALDLLEQAELGMPPAGLAPSDWLALRVARRELRWATARNQAEMVAGRIAQLLSAMLGPRG